MYVVTLETDLMGDEYPQQTIVGIYDSIEWAELHICHHVVKHNKRISLVSMDYYTIYEFPINSPLPDLSNDTKRTHYEYETQIEWDRLAIYKTAAHIKGQKVAPTY